MANKCFIYNSFMKYILIFGSFLFGGEGEGGGGWVERKGRSHFGRKNWMWTCFRSNFIKAVCALDWTSESKTGQRQLIWIHIWTEIFVPKLRQPAKYCTWAKEEEEEEGQARKESSSYPPFPTSPHPVLGELAHWPSEGAGKQLAHVKSGRSSLTWLTGLGESCCLHFPSARARKSAAQAGSLQSPRGLLD